MSDYRNLHGVRAVVERSHPSSPRRLAMDATNVDTTNVDTTNTSEDIDQHRRRFFGTAALTLVAAQFGMTGFANAQPGKAKLPAIRPGTHTSFGPLKQIDAGLLNVGYAEAGPADRPAVILLHGWPYDIYSFVDVAPLLASAGYRGGLPGDRAVSARLWHDAISVQRHGPQWPAVGGRSRCHCLDGCPQNRESNHRRF
jgi:hypothetical protein